MFTNKAGLRVVLKGQNLRPPTKPRKQTKVTFNTQAEINIIPNRYDPFMAGNHGKGMYDKDQNDAEVDQEEWVMERWKNEFTANVVPLLAPVEDEEIPVAIEDEEEIPVDPIPEPVEEEEIPAALEEEEEIPEPPVVVVPAVPLRRSARIEERRKKLEGLVLVNVDGVQVRRSARNMKKKKTQKT